MKKKEVQGIDEWQLKIAELQNELEQKNRMLEIEAALERVRVRSLAMYHSDELADVSELLFKELRKLGGDIWACGFILYDKNSKNCEHWMSVDSGKVSMVKVPIDLDQIHRAMYNSWLEQRELFTIVIKDEEIKHHYKAMSGIQGLKENIDIATKKQFEAPKWQKNHLASFRYGSLAVVTKVPFEAVDIFPRFAKVFEQTYTRFLDLQKAEVQAREAEIQLALERVRARTMAMQHSDELLETSFLLAQHVRDLGIKAWGCAFHIYADNEEGDYEWFGTEDGYLPFYKTPRENFFLRFFEKRQSDETLYIEKFKGKGCEEHYDFLMSLPVVGDALKDLQYSGIPLPTSQIDHVAYFKFGYLLFITYEPVPEAHEIFKRFAKAFEQTYTRFLDLQKAEAQAREAEIEASLERVRARMMAMQKYDDLLGVLKLLADQLVKLGIPLEIANFSDGLPQPGADWNLWFYMNLDGDSFLDSVTFPHTDHPFFHRIEAAIDSYKKGGSDLNKEVFTKEEKDAWIEYSYTQPKFADSPQEMKQYLLDKPGHAWSAVFLKDTWVSIIKNISAPFTDEEDALLRRFANIFGQTYTRFQDLKQAEAQAREAQIEAALERVRSRSIAMRKSEEIADVAAKIFSELRQLDLALNRVLIWTFNDTEKYTTWWSANPEVESTAESYRIDYNETPVFINYLQAWQQRKPIHLFTLSGETKKAWEDHLFEHTEMSRLPMAVRKGMRSEGTLYTVSVISDYGLMMSGSFEPLPEASIDIIQRFGRVFQQSYTRYLDVQKAETQAREAQIEAALERIRSRSLGMRKSDELQEVVSVVFEQLQVLNFALDGAAFIATRIKEFKGFDFWMEDRITRPARFRLPYYDAPSINDFYDAWDDQKDFVSKIYGQEKNLWFDYAFEHTDLKIVPEDRKKWILSQTHLTQAFAIQKNSMIGIHVHHAKTLTEDEIDILKRVSKVFEQAYTRFLDLQKAEAQAREAEIVAALERLRSLALGMRKSEEVGKVSDRFFVELTKLTVDVIGCSIVVIDKQNDSMEIWRARSNVAVKPFSKSSLTRSLEMIKVETPEWYSKFIKLQGSKGVSFEELSGEKRVRFLNLIADQNSFSSEEKSRFIQVVPDKAVISILFFKIGYLALITNEQLPGENLAIARRFADVFDFAYTRFLDLQKAEAQGREAQIEAALERVRSKTMGMRRSEELQDAAVLLFQQVIALGVPAFASGFNIWDDDRKFATAWMSGQDRMQPPFKTSSSEDIFLRIYEAEQKGESLFVEEQGGEALKSHYEYMNSIPVFKEIADKMATVGQSFPNFQIMHCAFFSHGYLMFITFEPVPDAHDIFKRFAKVFEQTYTRFLDLKKAEAQAREAEIEAALERVRYRSMSIQKSSGLQLVIEEIFNQLQKLGINLDATFINSFEDDSKDFNLWIYAPGEAYAQKIHIPYFSHPIMDDFFEAKERGNHFLTQNFSKKIKNEFFEYAFEHSDLKLMSEERKKFIMNAGGVNRAVVWYKYSAIGFQNYENIRYTEFDKSILIRFASVFEQSYTRFLDLQKAETQAREAQIEAALEKVRSRSLAMHNSEEIAETTTTLFEQLNALGELTDRVSIGIINEGQKILEQWATNQKGTFLGHMFNVSLEEPTTMAKLYNAWKEKKDHFVIDLKGQELKNWLKYVHEEIKIPLDETNIKGRRVHNAVFFSNGMFMCSTHEPIKNDVIKLLIRFAKVFDQAYTRFLDLQKAEAQAREAQIEIALERVRARSMAMHKSEEIQEVANVVFEQLHILGVSVSVSMIILIDENIEGIELWLANEAGSYAQRMHIPYIDNPIYTRAIKAVKNHEEFITEIYGEEVARSFNEKMIELPDWKTISEERKKFLRSVPGYARSIALCKYTGIAIVNYLPKPFSEKEDDTLKRFSKVFEQAYTRFLDLKKAEAQAREAQIEASLERVRSKAMAMHNSVDLSEAVSMVFTELGNLGIQPIRSGVGIISKESKTLQVYFAVSSTSGNNLSLMGETSMLGHQEFEKQYDYWLRKENYFVSLNGEELESYYQFLSTAIKVNPDINFQKERIEHGAYLMFSEGFLYAWSEVKYTETEIGILERFKKIVELTFRRYFDLKKAEAQAREATKQASLDRVRGEIASMRTSEDLNRITPVIWKELQALEVPFIRCGVFIIDETNEITHVYLSTPDGKALGVLNLKFNANELTKNTVEHWRNKRIFRAHWNKEDFINWTKSMMDLDQVQDAETYQGASSAPESLDLHFVHFRQGMLYVGNVSRLTIEKIELVKTLAEAFSIAYARYEDFKNLEDAKNKIEQTLTELKAAQAQLIQAEKMASLGELTAGIAHEIQNPLNFVNNFSDLNAELIDELKEELAVGNKKLADEIADDIKENETKINHHGRRAESIVRGMLLHSRSSSGQKEPTDINALADEYLRLSYHGLRAKDKSFNADFKLQVDESLPKVNVVPQEIGRVLLNLINNAFYAVSEKSKLHASSYKPQVIVSTKSRGDKIEIRVKDNGNGIPESVKEKMFQPFFTTKPTGEGTGLGLSLAFDIVKAHGGELQVETEEGSGTTFTVIIPNTKS